MSIELSEGIEDSLLRVFEARNIPDDVADAHGLSFTQSSMDVHDHYLDMVGRGEASVVGFVSNLKGKLAEVRVRDMLEDRHPGIEWTIASDPTQPVWDI